MLLPETAERGGAVLRALAADEAVLMIRNNLGRKDILERYFS